MSARFDRSWRRLAPAALSAAALTLVACAGEPLDAGKSRFGPGYVALDNNKRFGVAYDPEFKAALLKFTLVGSFAEGEEPPAPPTEEEWRAAAEKIAPEGCDIVAMEKVDEETYRAVWECEDEAEG